MSRRPLLRSALGVTCLTLALSVAGCGDSAEDPPAQELSDTEHNEADVSFATDMIQHHAQALAMADLTLGRPLDPKVSTLVEDIRAAQAPEIETFADWLVDWDEPVPETMRDHGNAGHDTSGMGHDMEGMDHGDMPGMMTPEEMTALEESSDAEFQALWLEMMIEHHEGAVEMAKDEQDDGRYRPAVELAEDIETSQSDEIDTMESLLGS